VLVGSILHDGGIRTWPGSIHRKISCGARRARNAPLKLFAKAREETASLTERIEKIEQEIDDRVAALYGL